MDNDMGGVSGNDSTSTESVRSSKWRPHWTTGTCLKKCLNRDQKCDVCFKFSELKEKR